MLTKKANYTPCMIIVHWASVFFKIYLPHSFIWIMLSDGHVVVISGCHVVWFGCCCPLLSSVCWVFLQNVAVGATWRHSQVAGRLRLLLLWACTTLHLFLVPSESAFQTSWSWWVNFRIFCMSRLEGRCFMKNFIK